jgi:hypothetical protein
MKPNINVSVYAMHLNSCASAFQICTKATVEKAAQDDREDGSLAFPDGTV